MSFSEDRVSHLAHEITQRLWRDDLADLTDEARGLAMVKRTLGAVLGSIDDIDGTVRAKIGNRTPGSREWRNLYQKFFQEEIARRGL